MRNPAAERRQRLTEFLVFVFIEWIFFVFRAGTNVLLSPKAEIPIKTRHDRARNFVVTDGKGFAADPRIVCFGCRYSCSFVFISG